MGWDDEEEDDWEKQEDPELKQPKKSEWSDEEEEEEEASGEERIAELRKEKEEILKAKDELEKKLAAIEEQLPFEQPKESSKKGKLTKKLLAKKDDEDRKSREEAIRAESQVSKQQKIEESDFANAQDMFGGGDGSGSGQGQGKFESWVLTGSSKQPEYEEFASYAAEKISKFSQEFLYVALMRKLLQETTKSLEARQVKELLLVLTKGRTDFTVIDLTRGLLRDADRDIAPEDIQILLHKKVETKKGPAKDKKPESVSARAELFKLLLQDYVKDMKPEEVGRIVEEGCGVILTNDQQKKISAMRAELAGDPAANKDKGKPATARVADHKSMAMYDAFGAGGGDDWGGGGGTRGDDLDFM